MRAAVIPWHLFVEALKNQRPEGSELWLRRWRFEDNGVWVGARTGRDGVLEMAERASDRENFAENLSLSRIQLTAVNCEAHLHSLKTARKTAVTREEMPAQPADPRRSTQQVNCERCIGHREARYRAFTDNMDMKVCASCAEEAKRLAIFVEKLGSQNEQQN